jgi:acyl-CoA dehydrogenase
MRSLLGRAPRRSPIADGPTEEHKVTLATQLLEEYQAVDGLWPSGHIPTLRAKARARYAALIEHRVGSG